MSTFNVTKFTQHKGIYYEFQNKAKISHTDWDLVAYTDLTTYSSKYLALKECYDSTANVCSQLINNHGSTSIPHGCQQFSQATLPYLYEIENNHNSILASIEEATNDRHRRGIERALSRLANVLYGSLSNLDFDLIIKKVVELKQNKQKNTNAVEDKIRIVQTSVNEAANALHHLEENQEKLQENALFLYAQIYENTIHINETLIKTKLLEQSVLLEIMLNQYAYETQNLIGLVTSAISGNIYANVFTPNKLLKELREIKINLPSGTYLPIELSAESLPQLFRITDISVIHKDHFLIFVAKIPLIINEEYNVYKPIPLPIPFNNNTLIMIAPEVDYLALSDNNEKFFLLTENHWEVCKQLKNSKLCKGNQPIHHRSNSELCEIQLLSNMQKIPETCKVKFFSLESPIWHGLTRTNSWLFYTKVESCTITCLNSVQPTKIEISGCGRLNISPNCEIHTTNSILLPMRSNSNNNVNLDLVPENLSDNPLSFLEETLKFVIPQNFTNVKAVKDFVDLARKILNVNELVHKDANSILILQVEFNIIMLYSLVCIIIIIISILILRIKKKIIKIYEPELADNVSGNSSDENVNDKDSV